MTGSGPSTEKTSISLPADLAEYARRRAAGNTSAYIAGLIERDKRNEQIRLMLEEHGYVGDLAITEAGKDRMRARLARGSRSRAQRREQSAA
ncbi:hypothetical protein [Allorhizocola rhizosphaerae]|uniref:hypothetical protein n=1 Tax=Allorhizocola rhizosphaerae TaxID=1872709 RepID=UPI000E3E6C40|nr:hypothetical protein [Allorhizocola rhizosphaerae]